MAWVGKGRGKPTKADSQERHAIRRALERFDVDVTAKDLRRFVTDIQEGRARRIRQQTNRVSFWEVELPDGTAVAVGYDNKRKTIMTIMPIEWAEKGGDDAD